MTPKNIDPNQIVRLLNDNISPSEIAKMLSVTKPTISYWIKKLNLDNNLPKRNWSEIQAKYDNGATYRELCTLYNISTVTLTRASKNSLFKPKTKSQAIKFSRKNTTRYHSDKTKSKLRQHMIRRLEEGTYPTLGKNFSNREQSYPEKWFESVIKDRFTDQNYTKEYKIGSYSLDFAWVDKKLCIEIDGATHEQTIEKDKKRDEWVNNRGWQTLRIKWKDCVKDKEKYIKLALDFINSPP